MKKLFCLMFLFLMFQDIGKCDFVEVKENNVSQIEVFSKNNKFGLKNKDGNEITHAEFKKLIAIGDSAWICQKRDRFGIINSKGEYLIKPVFRNAERLFGKFAKLGNDNHYGIFDETGKALLEPQYSLIEPLFGGMFVTCKNYKYGIISFDGNLILDNKFDDIYMPNPKIMRIQYEGKYYEIERADKGELIFPEGITQADIKKEDYTITDFVENTGVLSGYSVVSFTDYLLKIFSSISPAYEQTIDELMFSKGADSVNVIIKASWIPRFPFTYTKKYYQNLRAPNNGPLSKVKTNIKRHLK